MDKQDDIPYGFCHCGCGEKTRLAPQSSTEKSWVKGEPVPFIHNHHGRMKLADRFWSRIDQRGPDDCWEWTGPLVKGYGGLTVRRGKAPQRRVLAHRFVYEQLVGPIPDGLHLDHLCRNRACVNPAHLEPVTCKENLLRGEGLTAKRAAQTHCVNGHEFTPENTGIRKNGCRTCKLCNRERGRRLRATRKSGEP